MTMAIIGAGAMIVLLAIIVERQVWRDPLRLTVLATWVAAMVINVGQGFYIELHEASSRRRSRQMTSPSRPRSR